MNVNTRKGVPHSILNCTIITTRFETQVLVIRSWMNYYNQTKLSYVKIGLNRFLYSSLVRQVQFGQELDMTMTLLWKWCTKIRFLMAQILCKYVWYNNLNDRFCMPPLSVDFFFSQLSLLCSKIVHQYTYSIREAEADIPDSYFQNCQSFRLSLNNGNVNTLKGKFTPSWLVALQSVKSILYILKWNTTLQI